MVSFLLQRSLLLTITVTCLFLTHPLIGLAETFSGSVISVADGDTITVSHGGQTTKVRLNGIDCPESHQAYGADATAFTSTMVQGQEVTIKEFGQDRYGRTIGDVMLQDGTILNRELVKAGACWWFYQYSDDESLRQLESEARAAHKGLWADANAIPPWDFRHLGTGSLPSSASRGGILPDTSGISSQELDQHIRGNRRSKKYHRPDCPSYTRISPRNWVPFTTSEEAEAAGYTLAGNCP